MERLCLTAATWWGKTQTARWDKKSKRIVSENNWPKNVGNTFPCDVANWCDSQQNVSDSDSLFHQFKNTQKYHKPKHRRLLFKVTVTTVTTRDVSSRRPSTSAMLQRFCCHLVSTRSVYLPRPLGGNFLYLHFFVFSEELGALRWKSGH